MSFKIASITSTEDPHILPSLGDTDTLLTSSASQPPTATQKQTPDLMGLFLDRLFRRNEFLVKLGLKPIQAALIACQNPGHSFQSILIAGTNGKGSVASLLSAMFCAEKTRCGLFTSPHFIHFAERIRVDGIPIPEEELLSIALPILAEFGDDQAWPLPVKSLPELQASLSSPTSSRTPPLHTLTYFEIATLTAAIYFARQKCRVACFEVGLGGRLDATNALSPTLSIITALGLDHEAILGTGIEAIAREKAGIMRAGIPVIIGSRRATNTLLQYAKNLGAPALCIGRDFNITRKENTLVFQGLGHTISLPIPQNTAPHAEDNIAVAVAAHLTFNTLADLSPNPQAIAKGLAQWRWPGRLWMLPEKEQKALNLLLNTPAPPLLLDAAHNPLGARALADFLEKEHPNRPLHFILGAMHDKDIPNIVDPLSKLPQEKTFTVTTINNPRACEPATFAARAGLPPNVVAPNLLAALKRATTSLPPDGLVIIAGSIYLLGELLNLLGTSHTDLVIS